MPHSTDTIPVFNLWSDPWITVERMDGSTECQGIAQTLIDAHRYRGVYENSPLVVIGIHRLLVAVLQAALNPKKRADLLALWQAGQFPPEPIVFFSTRFANRFDLFSERFPFMQSADLPLETTKVSKTVAYLAPEVPAGTSVTHFRHGAETNQVFCPACAAKGLVCIPAFATSGGQGIKPSINGVPPLYVLPGGESLFESLAASLTQPGYQPRTAATSDHPWWDREPEVGRSHEVFEVGYLQSLTFPARRIRLHPEILDQSCSRCGATIQLGVRRMVFEMGESRSKDAEPWLDPFVAYKKPGGKSQNAPIPIRPTPGKAIWREFAGLFLRESSSRRETKYIRPAILDQLDSLEISANRPTYAFRCIGLRTDMKAKVFEWVDAGFEVPPRLLHDENAAWEIQRSVDFATTCASIASDCFQTAFSGRLKKYERHKALRVRMVDRYWATLAAPFRELVLTMAVPDQQKDAQIEWADRIVRVALAEFNAASQLVGDDAITLRNWTEQEKFCHIRLSKKRKEYLDEQ